ncbi:MAG: ATP-binding protein [Bacteroidales bacterium]|nr:ATP-binding protein [Bacteroidales bacterium]
MIQRSIQPVLLALASTYPVVTITGPRQAGKTTLAKQCFPTYTYCNLEHPQIRLLAQQDPVSFFKQYPAPLIIDEIQHVPDLLSYIQTEVDERQINGLYILTGSQQLHLNAAVSQSLAGRTAMLTLLPLSIEELTAYYKQSLQRDTCLYTGFLPRIYDQQQAPGVAYRNYLQTYIERDVRQLLHLKDLHSFEKFLYLLAGRIGQIINLASLANDTGVSATTISNWLSVLEASYVIFRLHPYFNNLGKRYIKSPKLYFVETGLAAHLLGLEEERMIARDPLLGGLFENMMVIEALKFRYNQGKSSNLYFYRDSKGMEIDLLIKLGAALFPIEIKSSMTWQPDFSKNLHSFNKLIQSPQTGCVVYGGSLDFRAEDGIMVKGFEKLPPYLASLSN